MQTRLTSALLLALVLVPAAATAYEIRTFQATADRAAEAATKSIKARGVVTSVSDGGRTIEFAVGETWGRLSITEKDGMATIDIVSNAVHTLTGDRRPDRAILDGVAADLAGKTIKPDNKSRAKAEQMEAKRAALRDVSPLPSGPANILVRADRETVKSALIAECASKGFTIAGETEHSIAVSKDTDADFNLIGRALFGNATVRAYRVTIQFMLSTESEGTRVTTAADILGQNGYGATARQVVTDDPQAKSVLQGVLDGLKARVERQSVTQR